MNLPQYADLTGSLELGGTSEQLMAFLMANTAGQAPEVWSKVAGTACWTSALMIGPKLGFTLSLTMILYEAAFSNFDVDTYFGLTDEVFVHDHQKFFEYLYLLFISSCCYIFLWKSDVAYNLGSLHYAWREQEASHPPQHQTQTEQAEVRTQESTASFEACWWRTAAETYCKCCRRCRRLRSC